MDEQVLRTLLSRIAAGDLSVDDAVVELRDLPFRDLGDVLLDRHRELRTGFPEVVLASHKTPEQVARIVRELEAENRVVLVTRLDPDRYAAAQKHDLPAGDYHEQSHTFRIVKGEIERRGKGTILVVTAGTSDIPVAEEAAITAETFGNEVNRVYDAGVAGIHRILGQQDAIDAARVIVVVAGMDAALPSVVAGLTDKPVLAVPTSVGYGASLGGLAALLGLLNSCASGVTVLNIDNGFGAGIAAARINRL